MQLVSRQATGPDWPFIADCMRRGLHSNCPYAVGLGNEAVTALIEPLLASLETVVWTPKDANSAIVSFLVHGPQFGQQVVAWVHVRKEFRGQGLAMMMLRECGYVGGEVLVPFLTNQVKVSGTYRLRFRPWLGMELKGELLSHE